MQAFIGQIMMFGGTFAPRGWALCDGQLLAISSNTALFSILGTTYGGDGRTTFGLPDLRSRVPIHAGHGLGLSNYPLGAKGGNEFITLNELQMPVHTHLSEVATSHNLTLKTTAEGEEKDPSDQVPGPAQQDIFGPAGDTTMETGAVTGTVSATNTNFNAGGSQPHSNVQPYQAVNYIIALQGIYPSRG